MLEELQIEWALGAEGKTKKLLRERGLAILGGKTSVEKRGPEGGFRTALFPAAKDIREPSDQLREMGGGVHAAWREGHEAGSESWDWQLCSPGKVRGG